MLSSNLDNFDGDQRGRAVLSISPNDGITPDPAFGAGSVSTGGSSSTGGSVSAGEGNPHPKDPEVLPVLTTTGATSATPAGNPNHGAYVQAVTDFYNFILGRSGSQIDQGGLDFWVHNLETDPNATIETVRQAFFNSAEYKKAHTTLPAGNTTGQVLPAQPATVGDLLNSIISKNATADTPATGGGSGQVLVVPQGQPASGSSSGSGRLIAIVVILALIGGAIYWKTKGASNA